jgi:predicted methyltransferase
MRIASLRSTHAAPSTSSPSTSSRVLARPGARSRRLGVARAKTKASDDAFGPFAPPLEPLDPHPPLFCFYDARRVIEARDGAGDGADADADAEVEVSFDFYDTTTRVSARDERGIRGTWNGQAFFMPWDVCEAIANDERGVYEPEREHPWDVGRWRKVVTFSDDTERAVSLMPSGPKTWPTALIAGFSMHRFGVGVDPKEDTEKKLGAVAPIRKGARVLDVCTGLAYTASMAAARGAHVTTIELDTTMTKMCRMNPHSKALFSGRIEQLYGNGADVVKTFKDGEFDRIITDPPTFALAGELYSAEFYADLKRILKPKGKVYHYIGDPKSASGGSVAAGVVRRLKAVGFGGVEIDYDAHGIIAAHDHIKLNRTASSASSSPSRASKSSFDAKKKTASHRGGKKPRRPAGSRRFNLDTDDDDDDDDYDDHF